MIKFDSCKVTFQEIPTEVSLTFSITGCKNNCAGCHSPHLKKDDGKELTEKLLDNLIKQNKYITCVTFLGGDRKEIINLLNICKNNNKKTALYSGKNTVDNNIKQYLNYLKLGEYNQELGPLISKTTNQRLYNLDKNEDITYMFWNKL